MKSKLLYVLAALALAALTGCASYPRYVEDANTEDASSLIKALGIQDEHELVAATALRGNTLRSEIKMFVTDKTIIKRYFSVAGRVFFQDDGAIAYGFLPIPSGDKKGGGDIGTYGEIKGIVIISGGSCTSERLLITRKKGSGEHACWLSSCKNLIPGTNWSKWDCTIESGNTLRVVRQ